MDTHTVEQINQIETKRKLGIPLTQREVALFELYGIPLAPSSQVEDKTVELDETAKKTEFVREYLSPLLRAADLNIDNAKYRIHPDSHEEIITVTYNNGFAKDICVTADSLRAIITDVMAQV